MIFKRGRKRGSESAVDESTEESTDEPSLDELDDEATEAESETSTEELEGEDRESADLEGAELAALDELDWRTSGPYDIGEVDDIESTEESPRDRPRQLDPHGGIRFRAQTSGGRRDRRDCFGDARDRNHRGTTRQCKPETPGLFVGTGAGGVRGSSQWRPVG